MTDHNSMQRFGVIGGGAWGTALALTARRAGRSVILWAREPEVVDSIAKENRNAAFLPDIVLNPSIIATTDAAVASKADVFAVGAACAIFARYVLGD